MASRKSQRSRASHKPPPVPAEAVRPRFLPELVFGLVGPVKTDLKFIGNELEARLRDVGYVDVPRIRVSELIAEIHREIPIRDAEGKQIKLESRSEDRRLLTYMEAGNALRRLSGDPSILAAYAAGKIRRGRRPETPRAAIIHSLKTPEETHLLRRIYGVGFFLVGASSPRTVRENSLAAAIASDRGIGQSSPQFAECRATARTHREGRKRAGHGGAKASRYVSSCRLLRLSRGGVAGSQGLGFDGVTPLRRAGDGESRPYAFERRVPDVSSVRRINALGSAGAAGRRRRGD
jgi:hypothetical protein